MKKKAYGNGEIARDFSSKVDHILKNHLGIVVKKLAISMCGLVDIMLPMILVISTVGF